MSRPPRFTRPHTLFPYTTLFRSLFDTLQTYLGSTYVNDFNKFGRTWQVIAQADARFRDDVQDIGNLRTRNDRGEMVPIGSMVKIHETYGPDPVLRYNGY